MTKTRTKHMPCVRRRRSRWRGRCESSRTTPRGGIMSLTPTTRLPNIDPLIVHFVDRAAHHEAAAVDLLSLFLRKRKASAGRRHMAVRCGRGGRDHHPTSPDRQRRRRHAAPSFRSTPWSTIHADWAFRTTWFFVWIASVRLAVSYNLQPKLPILAGTFVVAVGPQWGSGCCSSTAEHGGQLHRLRARGRCAGHRRRTRCPRKSWRRRGGTDRPRHPSSISKTDRGSWRPVQHDRHELCKLPSLDREDTRETVLPGRRAFHVRRRWLP